MDTATLALARSGNPKAFRELWTEFLRWSGTGHRRTGLDVTLYDQSGLNEPEDFTAIAMAEFWRALGKWEPGRSAKFFTYAQVLVRNRLLKEVKKGSALCRIPASASHSLTWREHGDDLGSNESVREQLVDARVRIEAACEAKDLVMKVVARLERDGQKKSARCVLRSVERHDLLGSSARALKAQAKDVHRQVARALKAVSA